MMKTEKRLRRTKIIGVALALMLAASTMAALPAFAAQADTKETDATVTFKAGVLSMTSAPNFDFGSGHDISATPVDYPLAPLGTYELVISDLRGSGTGWNVLATLSAFKVGTVASLDGASITMTGTGTSITGTGTAPGTFPTATLVAGGAAVKVVEAEANEGLGEWTIAFQPNNVELRVLGNTARAGKNEATINWSLEDTP